MVVRDDDVLSEESLCLADLIVVLAESYLRSLFQSIKPVSFLRWYRYTDQAMMARLMATETYDISMKLDRDCRVFGCTSFECEDIDNHYILAGGILKNVHTGQTPACIHVPALHLYKPVFLSLFSKVYSDKPFPQV